MKTKITALILISTLLGSLFIWFGIFNVSAKEKHWSITTILLELTRDRSIAVHSKHINVPSLTNSKMIANGAKNYDAMCVQCHLSPKTESTELNTGLYPQPPVFHKEKQGRSPKEIYWIIKNGLKMTGMPAWGDFHSEQQLWEMTAFLTKLNGMSKTEYQTLVGEGGHTHKEGMGHGEATQKTTTSHHDNSNSKTMMEHGETTIGHHDNPNSKTMMEHGEHQH